MEQRVPPPSESPDKEREMLAFMTAYERTIGVPPTLREIAKVLGISLTSAVGRLGRAEERGKVERVERPSGNVAGWRPVRHPCETCGRP